MISRFDQMWLPLVSRSTSAPSSSSADSGVTPMPLALFSALATTRSMPRPAMRRGTSRFTASAKAHEHHRDVEVHPFVVGCERGGSLERRERVGRAAEGEHGQIHPPGIGLRQGHLDHAVERPWLERRECLELLQPLLLAVEAAEDLRQRLAGSRELR